MNKTELVNAIAKKTGQTATSVGETLSAFEAIVTEAVVLVRQAVRTLFLEDDLGDGSAPHSRSDLSSTPLAAISYCGGANVN